MIMVKNDAAKKISVAILCGGESSRMKKDKALLLLGGKTFLERFLVEFSSFDEILFCAKDQGRSELYSEALFPLCEELNLSDKTRFIFDETHERGPLEGLRRALLKSKNETLFVCACDMPFVKKSFVDFLALFLCSDYDCYVPTMDDRPEPLCAIYNKNALPAVEGLLKNGERKITRLFELAPTKFIPIEKCFFDKKIFFNINFPKDLEAAKKPFVFCVSGLKNSGKTRMVLALLLEAKKRGYKCAAIKHDGHDCFSDAEGTDTFLFSKAGSESSAVFSERRFMFCSKARKVCPDDLIKNALALNSSLDYVVIEGLKNSDFPKVELLRKGICEKSFCKKNLICRASDFNFFSEDGIPSFNTDDFERIFSCVEDFFKGGAF